MNEPRLQCLTRDLPGGASHARQARTFCEAGARWVQLRSKTLQGKELLNEASEVAETCAEYGAVFILNDFPETAASVGASGVHLGANDSDPVPVAAAHGADLMIGGTVNSRSAAREFVEKGVCAYAGVGPFRVTATKENHAPVLRRDDLLAIHEILGSAPAYVIGGVTPEDVEGILSMSYAGVAACGALFDEAGEPSAERVRRFLRFTGS